MMGRFGSIQHLTRRLWRLSILLCVALVGCLPSLRSLPTPVAPGPLQAASQTVRLQLQLELPRKVQTLPATWDEIMLSVEASGSAPVSQTASTSASTVVMTFQLPTGPATVSCELHSAGVVAARGTTTANLVAGNNPIHLVLTAFAPFVTALSPAVGSVGTTLTLEGNFPGATQVTFSGGSSAPATQLGPNRVQVTVPPGATSGPLSVVSSGSTAPAPPVLLASYGFGLQAFFPTYDQLGGARMTPSLVTARRFASGVVIGPYLYVIGGTSGVELASIERSLINVDGTLGAFSTLPTGLNSPRVAPAAVIIGRYLYVIGGSSGGNAVTSVERAPLNPDGSLGSFTTLTGLALNTPRSGLAAAVAGSKLYVVGGVNTGLPSNTVEQANIGADGSIGPFSTVPGVSLVMPRAGHTVAVLGGFLYAIGGNGVVPLDSVERATINPDGTLGTFATAPTTLGTARFGHASVVAGNTLYVLGGDNGRALGSIEQAAIAADGTLGSFSPVAGVTLGTARDGLVSVVIGSSLYALGGYDGTSYLGSLERASLNGTGTLGPVRSAPVSLTKLRSEHANAVIGNNLYVIGGYAGQGDPRYTDIERATVGPDGALGPFGVYAGSSTRELDKCSTAIIGNYLYVLGGRRKSALGVLLPHDFVQRASINPDGTITDLVSMGLQGITLSTPRYGHASVVIGNYLYVLGGGDTGFPVFQAYKTVERATINPDGTISNFAPVSGVSLVDSAIDATCLVLGNRLYVIAGVNGVEQVSGTYGSGVQSAPINPDGTIGTFTANTGLSLLSSRTGQAAALIGRKLYILGGHDRDSFKAGSGLTSIEVAAVNSDGSLGPFSIVPGSSVDGVPYPRNGVTLGNFFYLLGSESAGSPTVYRAPLQ